MASGILTTMVPGHGIPGTGRIVSESTGWTSVLGDWNGDGKAEIGVYKDGVWYLDNDGSGAWNAGEKANSFGSTGWTPVIGDWNGDATGTKIGVYKDGVWYLDNDGSGTWNTGDRANNFGSAGWTPVLGNWNGDATGIKIGVYKDGVWYLDNDGSGTWNAGDRANNFGASGWTSVLGDWNGDDTGPRSVSTRMASGILTTMVPGHRIPGTRLYISERPAGHRYR